jgi:protein TonB
MMTPPPPPKPAIRPRPPVPPPAAAAVAPLPMAPSTDKSEGEPTTAKPVPPSPEPALPAEASQVVWSRRPAPPVYPPRALAAGRGGEVVLTFTIETDGSVADIKVVSSKPEGMFDRAAITALESAKAVPIKRNGVAIRVPGIVQPLKFKLE